MMIVLTFDDGKTTRASYFDIPGTVYIIKNKIGSPGYFSISDLKRLHADGWDICNHTTTHPSLITKKPDGCLTELVQCKVFLEENDLNRGKLHVAYPYGSINKNVIQAMEQFGALTGRLYPTEGSLCSKRLLPRFKLPSYQVLNTTELHTLIEWVERSVMEDKYCILAFHEIVDYPSKFQWSTSAYRQFLRWIKINRIASTTISKAYEVC